MFFIFPQLNWKTRITLLRLSAFVACAAFLLAGCSRDLPQLPPSIPQPPTTPLPALPPTPEKHIPTVMPPPPSPPTTNDNPIVQAVPAINPPHSLEELVFHSDVIARANLLMAEPVALLSEDSVHIVSGKQEVVKGKFNPYFRFRFEVLEYLKGEGDDELAVVVYAGPTGDAFVVREEDFEEVQRNAELTFSHWRDARWDDREALIFLKHSDWNFVGEDSDYMEFASRYLTPNIHQYAISSAHTKAWLPSALPGSGVLGKGENALSRADVAEARYLTEVPRSIETLHASGLVGATAFTSDASVAISGIEQIMKDNEELLAKGRDTPDYEDCVRDMFRFDAEYRQWPPEPYIIEQQIASGRPAGHPVWPAPDRYDGTNYYARWWTTGPDSDLFIYKLIDDPDNDPTTGYAWQEQTTRPVPQGVYKVYYKAQPAEWVPCGYNPEADSEFRQGVITVTAPAGTLHEAFFDPVGIGDAVGADGESGVLKPASFTLDDSDTTIRRIDWRDGQVRMSLSPRISLPDHHIDFIALDGSVSLRLDFDDAMEVADADGGQSLVWGVCSQPWQPGDLLMLRISQSPADLAGVTFNADCAPAATSEPTASPTPEVMPTHTPVPTSIPAPVPTPVDTITPTPTP